MTTIYPEELLYSIHIANDDKNYIIEYSQLRNLREYIESKLPNYYVDITRDALEHAKANNRDSIIMAMTYVKVVNHNKLKNLNESLMFILKDCIGSYID